MKKYSRVSILVLIIVMISSVKVTAHGGNITGWKDRNSSEIIEYNGKYYGYHKQNGMKHYHQVIWNEEKQKWEIYKAAVYYDENFNIINEIDNSDKEKIEVEYSESVDGDTAKFKSNKEIITVRFLGIDTPETVHPSLGEQPYGKEASEFTKLKLQNAKKVEIEYDSNSSKTDKYERHLAWIWVDNSLLQKELVEQGLAKTYMLNNDYKYAWILQESEEQAKEEKLGIWSEDIKNNKKISTNDKNLFIKVITCIFVAASIIILLIKKAGI